MPKRRPTNRLGDYSPQWPALLIEMRLITAKEASDAHERAVAALPSSKRRRRKPE
jgi:hypothetical protein